LVRYGESLTPSGAGSKPGTIRKQILADEHEIIHWLTGLAVPFGGEVLLLCFSQHLSELRISTVVGQDHHHRRIRSGLCPRIWVLQRPAYDREVG
jgi:hypothetical protein